jgi:hypothetical protein
MLIRAKAISNGGNEKTPNILVFWKKETQRI